MTYPYPALENQLQFLCTPTEYNQISKRNYLNPDYRRIIPFYKYACCPLCGTVYHEPADTYQLQAWGRIGFLNTLHFPENEIPFLQKRCKHFLGIHKFVNLHELIPKEVDYFCNSEGEVPYLTPQFFLEKIKTLAVLHALPICRIVDDTFVPSYTVFTLTYFSENPKVILEKRYARQMDFAERDPQYYPPIVHPAGFAVASDYNLPRWVQEGKLAWLDPYSANLALQVDQNKPLISIYSAIPGNRKPSVWNGGKQDNFRANAESNRDYWRSQKIFVMQFRRIVLHSLLLHLILMLQFLLNISLLNIPIFAALMYSQLLFLRSMFYRRQYGIFITLIPSAAWTEIRRVYKTLALCLSLLIISYVLSVILQDKVIYQVLAFLLFSITGIFTLVASASTAGLGVMYALVLYKWGLFPKTDEKMSRSQELDKKTTF